MKKILLLLLVLVFVSGLSSAQKPKNDQYTIVLNGNKLSPEANFQKVKTNQKALNMNKTPVQSGRFIIQFNSLPTDKEQDQLKDQGVELLSYLQGNAYFATVSSNFLTNENSATKNVRSLMSINPEYKISQDLANGDIPEYAKGEGDYVKVVITYFKNVDESSLSKGKSDIKLKGEKIFGKFHQIQAEVLKSELLQLASVEWVQNIEMVAPPAELDNDHGKSLHRANVLNSNIPGLGYGLTGKGVKIGLWDADVYNHRDFNGRVINREFEMHNTDHGTHTAGTLTSAGLIDPKAQGMAPDAKIFAWNFNIQSNGLPVPYERLESLDNDSIEITSNSWGYNVTTCPNPYAYNATDNMEDQIANFYPYFLYVFSAGNNQSVCSGGYRTTSKNMKNSLMVAAVDQADNMSSFSSFGPSRDGRLIPNISGDGVNTYSTFFDNGYGIMSGTSMATPGVAGTAALVYQRYKETHGGQQPLSSLMRALLCNTATDLGNPGPDYKFGFGEINGLRAVEVMEQNHYFINAVTNGTTFTKDITIPSGAVALKVMLSWTDPANTGATTRILINDLDLRITKGDEETLAWVLDPNNPSANAVRDYDGLNNMEQVTISNPVAGTYTINVDGYEIPSGAQEFAVVYDIVMPTLKLTYPIGGEYLTPGNQEVIRWDAEGYTRPFTIEYSADGGVNYTVIASNIASNIRSYIWTVPAGTTKDAKLRISNGSVLNVDKISFNIMPVPQNLKVDQAQCNGTGPFKMTWDAVANSKYEVFKLNGQVYEHLAEVTINSYDISGITQNKNNWYCVRAIDLTTGATSQRSYAVTVNPAVSLASTALPFTENFETEKADNFYFTANKGKGAVRYVNDAQKYGIRLEGTSTYTDWVASADASTCFANNPNYIAKATICNIDASSMAGKIFRLKFDYRQKYRSAPGTSYFRVKVNGNYLTNTDGTQIYGATNQVSYKTVYYDLTAYAGNANVTIEFEAVCKTNYTTYVNSSGNYDFSNDTYDVGDFVTIDNIEILEPLNDLSLTSLTPGAGVSNTEAITVKVKNLSGVSVSNVPVSYTINGGPAVNEVLAGPIAPLTEAIYTFTQTANLSVGGLYTIAASVNWSGDPELSNNTLTATKANNGTDIVMGVAVSPTLTCSGTLTDPSGRFADYAASQNKTLTIKPDAAGKNSKITFTEFATESGYDFVSVYNGPTTSSPLLGKFSGNTLPPSLTSTATGGELTINFTSDTEVNDNGFVATLECVDKPVVDMALTAITKPTPLTGIKTANEIISFTAINYGLTPVTGYDAYYQINSETPVKESFASSLITGASETKSFATTADLSVPGTYSLKVWVEIANDALLANNSKTITITSQPSTSDAGISAISAITPSRVAFSTILATVKNFGTLPISNFDVAYKINGGAEVVQTIAGPIAAGATANITFGTKADLTATGTTFNIDVYSKLTGDALASNDKMTSVVVTPNIAATNVVGGFNGTSSIAIASATPALNLQNNYSFELWANLDNPPAFGRIFDKTNVALFYQTHYSSAYPDNSFILAVTKASGSFTLYVPGVVNIGAWHHLALTVDAAGTNYKFYIDGVLQTWSVYSGTMGATASNATIPLYLGNNAALTRGVNGYIDEVRVWNTELSQANVQANMMTDFAANTAGLLAYYKVKEGEGKYLYDYSSNDNTATVSGADVTGMGAGKFWNTPGTLLTKLNIPGEKIPTTFDANTNTFTVIMDGTDLSSLVPIFTVSQNSVVKIDGVVQTSGVTSNDFSNGPVTYTVEGIGFNAGIVQNFTVNVTNDLSSECDLTAYSFNKDDNPTLVNSIVLAQNGNNYYKRVETGIDLSSLKSSFTISPKAKLYINGVEQTSPQTSAIDYSNPLMVTVMAENGRVFKNYSIFVDARSSSANLTAFNVGADQVGNEIINSDAHTVSIAVNNSASVNMLAPSYSISANAKAYVNNVIQVNGITANDFTYPLIYKVVSEDESFFADWKITVNQDLVIPVITLLGTNPVTVAQGSVYTDAGATAIDNIDGNISDKIVKIGIVNTATVGTYTLTYNVSDAAGNAAIPVTRTVNVTDQTKPVITLLGTNPITVAQGSVYTDAGATAIDNVDGNLTDKIVKTGIVNTDIVGTYTLTYNVSDAAGNAAIPLIRTVNVTDQTKPVITLLGSSPVEVNIGKRYTDAGATATDNVDGNLTKKIVKTGKVNTRVIGTYTLTYNVSDAAGNAAIPVTRTVNVSDLTKPVITLLGRSEVNIYVGHPYFDAGAFAYDNVDGNLTKYIVKTGQVNTSLAGTYLIKYNVKDAAGNDAIEVVRTVNVVKIAADITICNTMQIYNGTPKYVTVKTYPANLKVIVLYNGSTNAPREVGSYTILATIDDDKYEGTKTATLTIKASGGSDDSPVKIYSDTKDIFVYIPELENNAQVYVYNLYGTLVYKNFNLAEGYNKIDGNFRSGIYLVKVINGRKVYIEKVILIK